MIYDLNLDKHSGTVRASLQYDGTVVYVHTVHTEHSKSSTDCIYIYIRIN